MSMMLMVKAMRIKVGNPLRKLVLIKLADNASDSGECWPSHQHIADQCEISRRSVINHINKLEEMGFLRKEYRTKNNEKQSNLYHLTLDNPILSDLGSAGDSLPSAGDAQGGAGDSLGGSAGDAHRTSHSSEPINEPNPIVPFDDDSDLSKKDDSKKTGKKPEGYSERFEQWWEVYPRKTGKGAAWRKWKSEKLESRFDELIEKLKQQVALQYAFIEKTYIPGAARYLNEARYDDEIELRGVKNGTTANSNGNQRPESPVERARRKQRELLGQPDNHPD